jgi:hypothetical protein
VQPTNLEREVLELETAEDSLPSVRKANLWRRFSERATPKFVLEAKIIFKETGLRGVLRKYGWKVVAGFFAYYLVRDTLLYLVIPYLIAKGIF